MTKYCETPKKQNNGQTREACNALAEKYRSDINQTLNIHNCYRALENVKPMVWNEIMASDAYKSPKFPKDANLVFDYTSLRHDYDSPYAETVGWNQNGSIRQFYDEIICKEKPSPNCEMGHYTIMMTSSFLGCAIAPSYFKRRELRCNYADNAPRKPFY